MVRPVEADVDESRGHAQDEGQVRPAHYAIGRAVPGEDLVCLFHVPCRVPELYGRTLARRQRLQESIEPVKVAWEVGWELKSSTPRFSLR